MTAGWGMCSVRVHVLVCSALSCCVWLEPTGTVALAKGTEALHNSTRPHHARHQLTDVSAVQCATIGALAHLPQHDDVHDQPRSAAVGSAPAACCSLLTQPTTRAASSSAASMYFP